MRPQARGDSCGNYTSEAFKTCQESLIIVKPEAGKSYILLFAIELRARICSLGANASLLGALLENSDLKYKFVESG